jgi:hypothetical protein
VVNVVEKFHLRFIVSGILLKAGNAFFEAEAKSRTDFEALVGSAAGSHTDLSGGNGLQVKEIRTGLKLLAKRPIR